MLAWCAKMVFHVDFRPDGSILQYMRTEGFGSATIHKKL
jgi:hypothetical protein